MPNVVQLLNGKSMGTFSTIPVFDTLIKESLYTASMTFRCKGMFTYPPGTVACCFGATPTPFVVEEISYESQGISEVRCISVWELLKRRNKCGSYENLYPSTFSPIGIFNRLLSDINKDPNRWFVYWLRASVPSDLVSYEDKFDPSTSIYDDMYNAALYNQLYFASGITVTNGNPNNLDITLYAKSLNSSEKILDMGPLDSVSSRLTRRLPSAPTHWYIGKTSDYGMWKMASRVEFARGTKIARICRIRRIGRACTATNPECPEAMTGNGGRPPKKLDVSLLDPYLSISMKFSWNVFTNCRLDDRSLQ